MTANVGASRYGGRSAVPPWFRRAELDGLGPSEVEVLTGLTKADYEARILAAAIFVAGEVYPAGRPWRLSRP